MATQVASPGSGTEKAGPGNTSWNQESNIVSSNNSRSTSNMGANDMTEYLYASQFGFALPTGSTIDGISTRIERHESSGAGASAIRDEDVRLVDDTNTVRTHDKADTSTEWPLSDAYKTYGGATDKWGESAGFWTEAKVEDPDFGFVLSVKTSATGGGNTANVDHMEMTIHYTAPAEVTTTHTADFRKVNRITKTHAADLIRRDTETPTHTADLYLVDREVKDHGADMHLQGSVLTSHGADFIAVAQLEYDHEADLRISALVEMDHEADLIAMLQSVKAHGADALLKDTTDNTHLADLIRVLRVIPSHGADFITALRLTLAHGADFVKQGFVSVGHDVDFLMAESERLFKMPRTWYIDETFGQRYLNDELVDNPTVLHDWLGEIGHAQVIANSATFTTTETTLVTLNTAIPEGDRNAKLVARGQFKSTVAGDVLTIRVKEGATVLGIAYLRLRAANVAQDLPELEVYLDTPVDEAKTYTLTAQRTSGSGTITGVASSDSPMSLRAEAL